MFGSLPFAAEPLAAHPRAAVIPPGSSSGEGGVLTALHYLTLWTQFT